MLQYCFIYWQYCWHPSVLAWSSKSAKNSTNIHRMCSSVQSLLQCIHPCHRAQSSQWHNFLCQSKGIQWYGLPPTCSPLTRKWKSSSILRAAVRNHGALYSLSDWAPQLNSTHSHGIQQNSDTDFTPSSYAPKIKKKVPFPESSVELMGAREM